MSFHHPHSFVGERTYAKSVEDKLEGSAGPDRATKIEFVRSCKS